METLLVSVEEAQSNGEILDAYKIGSKALQNVLSESGLKYDNVDEIISDVKETIENHEEVQDAITNANLIDTGVDESELEQELKDLLGETTKKTAPPIKTATKPISEPTLKTKATTLASENNNGQTVKLAGTTAVNVNNNKPVVFSTTTDDQLLQLLNDLEIESEDPDSPAKKKNPKELLE